MNEQFENFMREHYYNPQRTLRDIHALLSQVEGQLVPTMDDCEGEHSELLFCLDGVVPIIYRDNRHFIPIKIFLPKRYPKSPPIVQICPNADMQFTRNAPVDHLGYLKHAFLIEWKSKREESYNLVNCFVQLKETFSRNPPVEEKARLAKNSALNDPLARNSSQVLEKALPEEHKRPLDRPIVRGLNSYKLPPELPRSLSSVTPIGSHLSSFSQSRNSGKSVPSNQGMDADADAERMAVAEILSLKSSLGKFVQTYVERKFCIASEFEYQKEFANFEDQMNSVRAGHESYHRELDTNMRELNRRSSQIHKLMGKLSEIHQSDVDQLVEPKYAADAQIFELVSDDLAIDDSLRQLKIFLDSSVISLDSYLRQVRKLGKEQFHIRNLLNFIISQK